ncbi:HalOD1 output domain-containing protein [Natronorubrum sp. FCH18a]|uniref:HalOD1 output domain-containing protein n=1 Tax=Natronorubrum sp. FCH18a TaxID=3447018 RepID=UPI003F514EAC
MKYRPPKCEKLSEAVIWTLAAEMETPPEKFRPVLYESVDPQALDEIFRLEDAEGRVSFEHAGYRITAHSSGTIELEEVKDES